MDNKETKGIPKKKPETSYGTVVKGDGNLAEVFLWLFMVMIVLKVAGVI